MWKVTPTVSPTSMPSASMASTAPAGQGSGGGGGRTGALAQPESAAQAVATPTAFRTAPGLVTEGLDCSEAKVFTEAGSSGVTAREAMAAGVGSGSGRSAASSASGAFQGDATFQPSPAPPST